MTTDTQTSTGRLEAFSDGVFAIAITLLILDLRVPRFEDVAAVAGMTPTDALRSKLWHLWPNFLAYFTSFVVVLVIWVNHHRVFTMVKKTDQAFLFWNGLLLMFVTLVPFPTALVSEYMAHGEWGQLRIAALVYSGNGFLISASFQAMWQHAIGHGRLLAANHDAKQIKSVNDEYRWAPAGYFGVFLIAFVAPWVSLGLCFLLVMAFSVQGLMNRKMRRR